MNRYNHYNPELDAFELYHLESEDISDSSKQRASPSDQSNAVVAGLSGAIGTSIANIAVYPIDLIVKRLQVQRQIRETQTTETASENVSEKIPNQDELYTDFVDAAKRIYKEEGGLSAFYAGSVQDTANSMGTAFLYFLSYNFVRQRRIQAQTTATGKIPKTLGVFEELSVGVLAGAIAKFFTAPIANVVTRKQTAALRTRRSSEPPSQALENNKEPVALKKNVPGVKQIVQDIYTEKGVSGFWAGYDATLILTLNPAITFFLYETFKTLLPRRYREKPTGGQTFLIAAVSKAIASSIMYPISLAKATSQVRQKKAGQSQFALLDTILGIYRARGVLGLYEGVGGEVLKGFFSNGITMLIKEILHRQILAIYFLINRIRNRDSDQSLTSAVTETAKDVYENSTTESQRESVNNLASTAQQKLEAAKGAVQSSVSSAKDVTGNAFSNVKETVQQASSTAKEATGAALTNAKESVQNASSSAKDAAGSALNSAKESIQNVSSSATDAAGSALNSAKESIQNVSSSAVSQTQNAFSSTKEVVEPALVNAKDTIQSASSNTVSTTQNALASAKTQAVDTAASVKRKIQPGVENLVEKTGSVLSDSKDKAVGTTVDARRGLANIISPDADTPHVGDVSGEIGGIEWSDKTPKNSVPKQTEDVGDKIAGIEWSDKDTK